MNKLVQFELKGKSYLQLREKALLEIEPSYFEQLLNTIPTLSEIDCADLSCQMLSDLPDDSLIMELIQSVSSLPKLTSLNLSQNELGYFSVDWLISMLDTISAKAANIRYLDFGDNVLGAISDQDFTKIMEKFPAFKKLEILNLSSNELCLFSERHVSEWLHFATRIPSLKKLNMSNNSYIDIVAIEHFNKTSKGKLIL